MAKSKDILKIKNLNVEFPIFGGNFQREVSAVHAVKDFNLSIQEGKTIGIVGESGSGKSTLGKAILNVLKLKFSKFGISSLSLYRMKSLFSASFKSFTPKHSFIVFGGTSTPPMTK